MSIYDSLNPEQKRAVLHDKGPLLILAGAGSGKTRVLTHRIAYLIEERGVNPWNILAITFTNKAAKEMRERVDKIVGQGSENIWVSTFHSTCVRILRRFIDTIGYDRNFTIYDTDDQKTLMRDVCKYLEVDTKQTKERAFLNAISSAKDELISPEQFMQDAGGDYNQQRYAKVYAEYQRRLQTNNALDFDDLIYLTVRLFQKNEEALRYFQHRFHYLMVDEYQDTNTAQFMLLKLLASYENDFGEIEHNLCVVGDDDQSIYKFRGANIQNILNFEKAYVGTTVIKLEQNYRSTKSILEAANEVIHNNTERKDKKLWTENEEGEPIHYTQFVNDLAEADAITSDIKDMVYNKGVASYSDYAILYRTNAQSRSLEESMIRKSIPYKLIGAINFYSRKEIKDILAYLKTIANGQDDLAVKRIINVPKRGIGLTTIDRISDFGIQNEHSFYEALTRIDVIPGTGRAAEKISSFVSLIEGIRNKLLKQVISLKDIVDEILEGTGYLTELEKDFPDDFEDRIANINELINKLTIYEEDAMDVGDEVSLSAFLADVALVSDLDNADESADSVTLMTLHAAKGLEFPYVYLCGLEEGIFPSYMSIHADNPNEEIEEERRLCYVGITRAMKVLYLSCASQRMLRGETQFNRPSRFIGEIPRYMLKMEAPKSSSPKKSYSFSDNNSFANSFKNSNNLENSLYFDKQTSKVSFQQSSYTPTATMPKQQFGSKLPSINYGVGDTVKHVKFGVGIVTDITSGGKDYEVTVDFPNFGTKKLLSTFAKLQKINS